MIDIKKYISIMSMSSLLLAGCATQPIDQATQQPSDTTTQKTDTQPEKYTIGSILPLTGDGAAYGIPLQRTVEYTINQLNEKGGINGKKLEIIYEDGKCSGKDASSAANKLINIDKVKIILGGFCSSETLGAAPLAENAKVVMLSPGSSSPAITDAGDFIFRNWPSDKSQAKLLAEKANQMGLKKVGIIGEKSDYAVGLSTAFIQTFTGLGGQTVLEEYLSDDSDFKTQLTKLKGENLDGLFINPQTPDKGELIVKQLQELSFKPKQMFVNEVITTYPQLVEKYGEFFEGTVGADVAFDENQPEVQKMKDWYKQKYGSDLPYVSFAATGYDAIYIISEAIVNARIDNPTGLRDYLYSIKDRQGLAGKLTIDKNGDPTSGHALKIIKAGKAEYL